MARDYMPVNDQQLDTWLKNFTAILTVNATMVGMTAAEVTPLTDASDEFTSALAEYIAEQTIMASRSNAKKTKRAAAVATLRPIVRRIQNHPGMTDQLRGLLGLPIPGTRMSPTGVGSEVPGIFVETYLGNVTVHFGTEPQNERINGKPGWARGCNVYRKRTGETSFRMIAFETASPFVDSITGDGAEYTYVVRYRGTRSSEIGQQSVEWTVAARGAEAA